MKRTLTITEEGHGVFTIEIVNGEQTHRIVQVGGFDCAAVLLNFLSGTPYHTPAPGKEKAGE